MPVRHVLQPGECLQTLALKYGFGDGKTLYDAAENADLRQKRKAPADVAPGDAVVIPDPKKRDVSVASGNTHKFKLQAPAVLLRVQVRDEAGEPLAQKPYALSLEGKTVDGTTTADGLVEQPLPPFATDVSLVVHDSAAKDGARWVWRVQVASLGAPETRAGAWQRLANLGYWSPAEELGDSAGTAQGGGVADALALAIRAFQHDEKLDESGRLDDATVAKLVERHGI
jgi:Putative peptidoglycan binding domain